MREDSKLSVTLITGRTIEQGVGKERGKNSEEYKESVSICFVDPNDLKKLGVIENTNIEVSTEFGSVVVKAVKSLRGPHPGIVFMPYGPWANVVVDPETHGSGMPSLKGIQAQVVVTSRKPFLSLKEIIEHQFGAR